MYQNRQKVLEPCWTISWTVWTHVQVSIEAMTDWLATACPRCWQVSSWACLRYSYLATLYLSLSLPVFANVFLTCFVLVVSVCVDLWISILTFAFGVAACCILSVWTHSESESPHCLAHFSALVGRAPSMGLIELPWLQGITITLSDSGDPTIVVHVHFRAVHMQQANLGSQGRIT